MTIQAIKNHNYEVIAANAAGATYQRHLSAGAWGPAGTIEFANGGVTFNGNTADRILCNDMIVAFDYYGNLGKAYRLYKAAFNRAPDQDGLSANVAALDDGVSLTGLAAAFLGGAEGQADYPPATSNAAFITALYIHVLGRLPSTQEVNDWLAVIANGATRSDVLVGFSESSENNNNVNPSMLGGVLMTRSYFGV